MQLSESEIARRRDLREALDKMTWEQRFRALLREFLCLEVRAEDAEARVAELTKHGSKGPYVAQDLRTERALRNRQHLVPRAARPMPQRKAA